MFPLDGFSPSPYAIPLAVGGTLMLLLGVFAAIRERWSSVGVSFLALTVAISAWFLGHALASSMESAEDTLWWIRSGAQIGATFIPAAVLSFALLVTGRWRRLWPLAAGSIAISLGFYLVSAMTDWFIASTHEYAWGRHPAFGWAGTLFVPYFFLLIGASLRLLWVERRTAPFRVRRSRAT
ncbi:MAG: histidine kinase N-terminal 7TM domain-containing protein, partial [Dehalococcoidia bacterium]